MIYGSKRMVATSGNVSSFGRTALSNVGESRSGLANALQPVTKTDPVRDATSREYRELQELKKRDREVRQHEQAHIAAGGAYVKGGPTYEYQRGADGKLYAVGGEVQIDTAPIPDDPAATIRKLETVQRAATAPGEPSSQDRAVAAAAAQGIVEARADLQREQSTATEANADFTGPRRPQEAADEAAGDERQQDLRTRAAIEAYRGTVSSSRASAEQLLDLIA